MKHLLVIATLLAWTSPFVPAEPPRLDAVRRGMSVEEVKRLLGPPVRLSREVLFRRYIEEWHYDDPAGWVEFDCVRGEAPVVRAIHIAR